MHYLSPVEFIFIVLMSLFLRFIGTVCSLLSFSWFFIYCHNGWIFAPTLLGNLRTEIGDLDVRIFKDMLLFILDFFKPVNNGIS